ncbi:hypothetical protein ACHAPA_009375 [Fusarium lateritium]
MKLIKLFLSCSLVLIGSVNCATGSSNSLDVDSCGPQKRIDLAKLAVANIKENTAAKSNAAYRAYPFSPDARIILNPNEVGDIQVSNSKDTSVAFLGIIYQIVTDVHVDTYANVDLVDNQTFFNVTGDLGLLHAIPLPAKVFFDVFLNYTLNPCQLEIVHVYAQVPSNLLGIFIDIATGVSPTPQAP